MILLTFLAMEHVCFFIIIVFIVFRRIIIFIIFIELCKIKKRVSIKTLILQTKIFFLFCCLSPSFFWMHTRHVLIEVTALFLYVAMLGCLKKVLREKGFGTNMSTTRVEFVFRVKEISTCPIIERPG